MFINNPLIGGNYADPSVIRVGGDFYMTHTSYHYLPGLIIWHSRDLTHWSPVSAALYEDIGDVWAPDFVEHNGMYYIYFPANRTNWVVSAPSPTGPWSRPVNLGIKGIDPGHAVGPDGKRYLHMSGGYFTQLSEDGLSVIGEPKHVYEGWQYPKDWEVEAFSLEGPKVTRRNGYYYLTVAEGGTAGPPTSHLVVSSRSRHPWGPWEHSPYNPIIRTRSAKERWWSQGHGSLIDSPDGQWWMVYHGYMAGFHTLGRHTLIAPIEWTEDDWYKVQETGRDPLPITSGEPYIDTFDGETPGLPWQCFGSLPSLRFGRESGVLAAEGASGDLPASPLLYMPAHERYEAEIELSVSGDAEGRLVLYYNDDAYLGIGASGKGVRHFRSFKIYKLEPYEGDRVFLRIRNDRNIISFYYRTDGSEWKKYDKVVDASGLHHNTFGGFLSLRVGIDAVGSGKVRFYRFSYKPE
ncbi:family 43 glycosylhydrolase [Paenibacillus tarimensis]